jgi:hypothetical protein
MVQVGWPMHISCRRILGRYGLRFNNVVVVFQRLHIDTILRTIIYIYDPVIGSRDRLITSHRDKLSHYLAGQEHPKRRL